MLCLCDKKQNKSYRKRLKNRKFKKSLNFKVNEKEK